MIVLKANLQKVKFETMNKLECPFSINLIIKF